MANTASISDGELQAVVTALRQEGVDDSRIEDIAAAAVRAWHEYQQQATPAQSAPADLDQLERARVVESRDYLIGVSQTVPVEVISQNPRRGRGPDRRRGVMGVGLDDAGVAHVGLLEEYDSGGQVDHHFLKGGTTVALAESSWDDPNDRLVELCREGLSFDGAYTRSQTISGDEVRRALGELHYPSDAPDSITMPTLAEHFDIDAKIAETEKKEGMRAAIFDFSQMTSERISAIAALESAAERAEIFHDAVTEEEFLGQITDVGLGRSRGGDILIGDVRRGPYNDDDLWLATPEDESTFARWSFENVTTDSGGRIITMVPWSLDDPRYQRALQELASGTSSEAAALRERLGLEAQTDPSVQVVETARVTLDDDQSMGTSQGTLGLGSTEDGSLVVGVVDDMSGGTRFAEGVEPVRLDDPDLGELMMDSFAGESASVNTAAEGDRTYTARISAIDMMAAGDRFASGTSEEAGRFRSLLEQARQRQAPAREARKQAREEEWNRARVESEHTHSANVEKAHRDLFPEDYDDGGIDRHDHHEADRPTAHQPHPDLDAITEDLELLDRTVDQWNPHNPKQAEKIERFQASSEDLWDSLSDARDQVDNGLDLDAQMVNRLREKVDVTLVDSGARPPSRRAADPAHQARLAAIKSGPAFEERTAGGPELG